MPASGGRSGWVRILDWVEDVLYMVVAVMLVALAVAALVDAIRLFLQESGPETVARVLDPLLVVMMLLELLHTVVVFIRTHVLDFEPLLVVALIASVRRILVLTVESLPGRVSDLAFRQGMAEYALNILFIGLLVWAIHYSRARRSDRPA
ncbi:MAG: phosphate-starvation-inducible PsiE family protein [Bacillota bacterium]|nr:phosphate-starvation-inducible PsiE family protein [Bacillota bacterium]